MHGILKGYVEGAIRAKHQCMYGIVPDRLHTFFECKHKTHLINCIPDNYKKLYEIVNGIAKYVLCNCDSTY